MVTPVAVTAVEGRPRPCSSQPSWLICGSKFRRLVPSSIPALTRPTWQSDPIQKKDVRIIPWPVPSPRHDSLVSAFRSGVKKSDKARPYVLRPDRWLGRGLLAPGASRRAAVLGSVDPAARSPALPAPVQGRQQLLGVLLALSPARAAAVVQEHVGDVLSEVDLAVGRDRLVPHELKVFRCQLQLCGFKVYERYRHIMQCNY